MSPSDVSDEIDRLKQEARKRWDDRWTVRVNHFSDGDIRAHAYRSRGRDDEGHLITDRLFLLDNDDIVVERTTAQQQEIDNKILETPTEDIHSTTD